MAATLYYLADESRMEKVASFFGIRKSTLSKLSAVSLNIIQNTLKITILGKWHQIFIIPIVSNNVPVQYMTRMLDLKRFHLTQVTLSIGGENTQ